MIRLYRTVRCPQINTRTKPVSLPKVNIYYYKTFTDSYGLLKGGDSMYRIRLFIEYVSCA